MGWWKRGLLSADRRLVVVVEIGVLGLFVSSPLGWRRVVVLRGLGMEDLDRGEG